MISNRRQAAISRRKREELLSAAAAAPDGRAVSHLELAREIGAELDEYEAVRDGRLTAFDVADVGGVGECLIKARLARQWTQRQLAAALGVTEQMVQRDEARSYENAGLSRIAEIADVLSYALVGSLRPAGQERSSEYETASPVAAELDGQLPLPGTEPE